MQFTTGNGLRTPREIQVYSYVENLVLWARFSTRFLSLITDHFSLMTGH